MRSRLVNVVAFLDDLKVCGKFPGGESESESDNSGDCYPHCMSPLLLSKCESSATTGTDRATSNGVASIYLRIGSVDGCGYV